MNEKYASEILLSIFSSISDQMLQIFNSLASYDFVVFKV